ncbi:substrate-binding periplasmic protein [Maridesulfovibrio sp.]|uniref:substrate-binding periplasmic protein n=1 Tax=Maridesulfovibrio sp. TaxID=2795000 RepID=UPI003BABB9B0
MRIAPILFTWKYWVLLCIGGALLLACAGKPAFAREVVTVATGEWAPYVSAQKGGNGMSFDIVSAAMKRAGLTAEYEFYPWKRALLTLENGKAMASFPWVKRPEREEFALYSDPLHSRTVRLFYSKNFYPEGLIASNIEELKKYRIGVARGYAQLEQYRKMGLNTVEVPDNAMGMQKLVRGHIDFMSESYVVGNVLIRNLFPDQEELFSSIPAPVGAERLYLLFTKKNIESGELLRKFNQGLQSIRDDGTFEMIVKQYGLY